MKKQGVCLTVSGLIGLSVLISGCTSLGSGLAMTGTSTPVFKPVPEEEPKPITELPAKSPDIAPHSATSLDNPNALPGSAFALSETRGTEAPLVPKVDDSKLGAPVDIQITPTQPSLTPGS